jgi:hypothetical protein
MFDIVTDSFSSEKRFPSVLLHILGGGVEVVMAPCALPRLPTSDASHLLDMTFGDFH